MYLLQLSDAKSDKLKVRMRSLITILLTVSFLWGCQGGDGNQKKPKGKERSGGGSSPSNPSPSVDADCTGDEYIVLDHAPGIYNNTVTVKARTTTFGCEVLYCEKPATNCNSPCGSSDTTSVFSSSGRTLVNGDSYCLSFKSNASSSVFTNFHFLVDATVPDMNSHTATPVFVQTRGVADISFNSPSDIGLATSEYYFNKDGSVYSDGTSALSAIPMTDANNAAGTPGYIINSAASRQVRTFVEGADAGLAWIAYGLNLFNFYLKNNSNYVAKRSLHLYVRDFKVFSFQGTGMFDSAGQTFLNKYTDDSAAGGWLEGGFSVGGASHFTVSDSGALSATISDSNSDPVILHPVLGAAVNW